MTAAMSSFSKLTLVDNDRGELALDHDAMGDDVFRPQRFRCWAWLHDVGRDALGPAVINFFHLTYTSYCWWRKLSARSR